MRRIIQIQFFIYQLISCVSFGQGFFNNDKVYFNPDELKGQGVCQIDAYSDYVSTSNRSIDNFVFSYELDSNGFIKVKKYWQLDLKQKKLLWWRWTDNSTLLIKMVQDSSVLVKDGYFFFNNFLESPTEEFDQESKNRKELVEQVTSTIEQGGWQPVVSRTNYGDNSFTLIDTVVLNRKLLIPKSFVTGFDSIYNSNDSIVFWSFITKSKHVLTLTDSAELTLEWYSNGNVWRTYLFDDKGHLTAETQGNHTTKYYYEGGLHVKTEIYQGDYLMQTTIFEYKTNCG